MAIICRKYRFLFIMTPRTACTAVGQLLLNHYGGEYLPQEDILGQDGSILVQQKHCTLSDLIGKGILTAADAKGLLKVASVRNPFDSLVSLYLKQRSKYQPLLKDPTSWVNRSPAYARNMRYATSHSFSQWVLKNCAKRIAKKLSRRPSSMFGGYTEGTDVVVRFENLAEELTAVFIRAGMPTGVSIPVVNRTEDRKQDGYRTYYSKATALAVRFAFWDDLKRYGYEF